MIAVSPEVSDRIVVIRNSASSHASQVQEEVIGPFQGVGLSLGQLVEFELPSKDPAVSTEALAEVLEPGDRLISPAGDGTGNLAVNAAVLAGQDGVRIGFLPYGNFNDMAATFTSKQACQNPVRLLTGQSVREARPLQVFMDGEHHRYALLYANLGRTAHAAAMYDDPEVRRALQEGRTGLPSNMRRLARSYFAERSSSALPAFNKDGETDAHIRTTDVLAVNGPIMGRVIRSARPYYAGETFLSSELDISSLLRNVRFLGSSALNLCMKTKLKLPGAETGRHTLDFGEPVAVPLQIDGEYEQVLLRTLIVAKDDPVGAARVQIIAA